jgi:hypothetical protein
MEYKAVKNSHIVPRGYLRSFAVNEIIAMHLAGEFTSREIPVSKAGVLNDFYLRHRRDGTPIHDIEWSLEHIERAAPPILREISERWPLSLPEKAILAEFIGTQLVRGPRWRNSHNAFTSNYFAGVRASREFEGKQPEGMTYEDAVADAERELSSDTATVAKMLELSRKAMQIIGSMHWTLITFARPWLATSDHPVVIWPLGVPSRQPKKSANFHEGGLTNTLEVRFPVSPCHALLMTWLDLPDDVAPTVIGNKEIAASVNAFTVAEAEHQWFHLPGVTAPRASGQLLPVAPRLVGGYSDDVARGSLRRNETSRRIQHKIGDRELSADVELLTIPSAGHAEIAPPPDDG